MRSLRAHLLGGSALWTVGVMLVSSVLLIVFLGTHPRPHAMALTWMMSVPFSLTLLVGAGCMMAGVARIRRGLVSIDRLRAEIALLQKGDRTRIDGALPEEVQPLVDALNGLLAERDQRVQRAVARAGDLAHGLKTPLAVLAAEVQRADTDGRALADAVTSYVDRMRRQIDYHLAHARAAASSNRAGVRTSVTASVDGLFRTLARLHANRIVAMTLDAPGTPSVRCQREDLDEMLGNLLDNACTWTRTSVLVTVRVSGAFTEIAVEDDGPGLEPTLRAAVLERGVRADQSMPGSGLGLAITRELAEIYGGTLQLDAARSGGVLARLTLPSG
ncbi:MAG: ATP-binding protein [Vicinamibacterales bacterium]